LGDIGLLFKISANSAQATSEIKKLRSSYDDELKGIRGAFKDALLGIGSDAGLTSAQMAKLTSGVTLAAGAITAIAGVAIATGAAILALAKSAADSGDRIWEMHLKTGFSVLTLSALDAAAKLNGTSLESLSASLVIFDKNIEAANEGSKKQQKI